MQILDPLKDGISSVELVRVSGSDLDVVSAARVCFGKTAETLGEREEKLINYLLANKHTSPFEHNQLVYKVKLPLFIARQWMRHRVGVSYNEISGRYSELGLDFYIPHKWRSPDAKNKQSSNFSDLENEAELITKYKQTIEQSGKTYKELIAAGVSRELARCVLPLCTYTEFIFTCNLVSLMHFLDLRMHSHAQWEIQQYANALLNLAQEHFPISLKAWSKLKEQTVE